MRAWLEARSRSELLILALAAVVVVGALYFLFVLEPLQLANARLQSRLAAEQALQKELVALREEVAQLRRTVDTGVAFPTGASLLSVVTATARDAGVQQYTRKMTPAGNDALSLVLEDIPFSALSAWLVALDRDQGVEVDRISIDLGTQPGVVSSQMMLKTRQAGS